MEIISLENRIKKTENVINNIFKLHAIPQVLAEILNYLGSESVNNTTLTKMILRDQNFAIKILAIANSPLYGLQRKVTNVDFAVMVLGVEEIRHIVSSLSMLDAFKNKSDNYLDYANFWEHSFLVGSVAKKIAVDLKQPWFNEVFTAGFLHDLGVPVIHRYFHSSFMKIKSDVETNGTKLADTEIENIGMSHSEIAFRLLDKWNLPINLCEIAKYHHNPLQSEKYAKQSAIVHLADYSAKHLGIGTYFWDNDLQLDMEAASLFGFTDREEVLTYIESFRELLPSQLESMRFYL